MLVNDYVLMELNQQRRAQVAEAMATARATKEPRQWVTSLFRWRRHTAGVRHPAPPAVALRTASTPR